MRKFVLATILGAAAMSAVGSVYASPGRINPLPQQRQGVMPAGDSATMGYSTLKQIGTDKSGNTKMAILCIRSWSWGGASAC
jgi:hypothetical protein